MGSPYYTATVTAMIKVKFKDDSELDHETQAIEALENSLGVDCHEIDVLRLTDIEKEIL